MPPKSGVLTLCACVCARPIRQGDHCFITAYKVCAHVCSQTAYLCRHLRFPQKTRSDGVALGYCGDYVRQQNKKKAPQLPIFLSASCLSAPVAHAHTWFQLTFAPILQRKSAFKEKPARARWSVRGGTEVQQHQIYLTAKGASTLLLLRLEFPFYRSLLGSCNHILQPDVKFTSCRAQRMPLQSSTTRNTHTLVLQRPFHKSARYSLALA